MKPLHFITGAVALVVLGSVFIVSNHHRPAAVESAPVPVTFAEPAPMQGPAKLPDALLPYTQPQTLTMPPPALIDAPPPQAIVPTSDPTNLARNPKQAYTPPRAVNLPLSVSILGDEDYKLGKPIMFTAILAGPVVEIQWKVKDREHKIPVAGLTAHDGGRNASFTGDVGRYTVTVAVGGENGAVDFWDHDFEIVPKEARSTDDVPPERLTETEGPQALQQPQQAPMVDLTTYIANLVNGSVQSPQRNTEAVGVGAAFRETANLIATNQYTGSDPSADVRKAAGLSLGQSVAYWSPFFNGIDALLANLKQAGHVRTNGDVGILFAEVGKVLVTAR